MPLDDYILQENLGRGGFGAAYVSIQKASRTKYVMKIVPVNTTEKQERAIEECRILSQLHHSNIVAYQECFMQGPNIHLVMELCSGGDLAKEIKKRIRFDESQIITWTRQACDALQYIHDNRVMHRDLKPSNIFITASRQIKLGDFGVSRKLESQEVASTVIGTISYLAPEVLRQQRYGFKVDVWSLGCCVYEMMTFSPAVTNLIELVATETWKVGEMPKMYSSTLKNAVREMLTVNPDQRPTVLTIIQRFATGVDGKMNLVIRVGGRNQIIQSDECGDIESLYEHVARNFVEFPNRDTFYLYHKGQVLDQLKKMRHYELENMDDIDVVFKMKGGNFS